MIKVTRLNGSDFWINAELIEFIEETPDTVLSLTTGHKFIVKESAQAIITAVILYRRQIFQQSPQILKGGI
jgi:flagellar protein FlbD